MHKICIHPCWTWHRLFIPPLSTSPITACLSCFSPFFPELFSLVVRLAVLHMPALVPSLLSWHRGTSCSAHTCLLWQPHIPKRYIWWFALKQSAMRLFLFSFTLVWHCSSISLLLRWNSLAAAPTQLNQTSRIETDMRTFQCINAIQENMDAIAAPPAGITWFTA